ncbi:hypothetical protein ACQ4PT_065941 [Festuca glaucescens]
MDRNQGGGGGGGNGGNPNQIPRGRQAGNKRRYQDRPAAGPAKAQPQQEAALCARALAEQGARRQGAAGLIAGGNPNGNNPAPPQWWVERERKRAARRAQEEAGAVAAPLPTALGRGRAVEIAAGKQPVAASKGGSGQGPSQAGGAAKDGDAASRMECFKCGRMGHFQADCTYPPVCLLCGVEGHFSAACTSKGRQPSLRVLGQAVAGESFFSLDFEEDDDEEELVSNGAIISFGAVSLSARELDRELHHLVEAEWDWQVQALLGHSFAVTFPSRETLRMSTRGGKLYLPLSGTVADIRLADADPAPAEQLHEVWVRLSGVPRHMKRANRLLAGMGMLGWPIAVDEESLKRPQPVRMLLACRNPAKLKGTMQLFHKKWGYNIGVAVEAPAGPSGGPSPPAHHKPGDDDDDDDVDDLSLSEGEWDDLGEKDAARKAGAAPGGMPAAPAPAAAPPAPMDTDGGSTPSRQDAPGEGGLQHSPAGLASLDQYGSNLPRKESWPVSLATLERRATPVLMEVDVPADSAPLASSALLAANSDSEASPSKNMPREESEEDEDEDGELLDDVDDSERASLGLSAAGGVPRRRRTKTIPVGPARKSARLQGPEAALPVMQRAQGRAASKNLEGNPNPTSSLPSMSQFSVLPALSDSHLETVAHDFGLAFFLESGATSETLSLI